MTCVIGQRYKQKVWSKPSRKIEKAGGNIFGAISVMSGVFSKGIVCGKWVIFLLANSPGFSIKASAGFW